MWMIAGIWASPHWISLGSWTKCQCIPQQKTTSKNSCVLAVRTLKFWDNLDCVSSLKFDDYLRYITTFVYELGENLTFSVLRQIMSNSIFCILGGNYWLWQQAINKHLNELWLIIRNSNFDMVKTLVLECTVSRNSQWPQFFFLLTIFFNNWLISCSA